MQNIAQEAVTWGVQQAVAEGIGAHRSGARRACVRLRARSSRWSAARRFSLGNQYNRAWQALRQPGSSFKIYDYTAAIDSGMPASTIIDDSPVSYPMGDGTQWSPLDDDHSYMGAITLREALDAFAQRRRGEARRARRPGSRHRLRASHGRHRAAGGEPFARARVVGRLGARSGQRLLDAGKSRAARRPHAVPDGEGFVGQRRLGRPLSVGERRRQRGNGIHHDLDTGGRHQPRNRLSERGHRTPGRRQDRHDLELSRRVVRRLHARSRRRRLARQRRLTRR